MKAALRSSLIISTSAFPERGEAIVAFLCRTAGRSVSVEASKDWRRPAGVAGASINAAVLERAPHCNNLRNKTNLIYKSG
jgi:hypothetical protein